MRVAIVGAGVIGLCTALSLRKRGHDIVVIDRIPESADRCSNGNAGMVTPSHFVPLAAPGMVMMGLKMLANPKGPFRIKPSASPDLLAWMARFASCATVANVERNSALLANLNLESRSLYEKYSEEFGGFDYHQGGILMLAQSESTLTHEAEIVPKARALGVEAEVVTREKLREVEPGIRMEAAGGVLFRSDGTLVPQSFLTKITEHLRGLGVEFVSGEVQSLVVRDGRAKGVVLAGKTIDADAVVVAAGTWSERLLRQHGVRMPLQPGKGYSFLAQGLPEKPGMAAILIEARVAVTPMGDGVRFAGTMEVGDWSSDISRPRVEGILESIPKFYPGLAGKLGSPKIWHGHRPCSPDGVPYIGESKVVKDLWIGAGHAMMGLSLGPVTGEILAKGVAGEPTGFEMTNLEPDRFA